MSVPKMPDEYKGKTTKNGGYTTSNPREWTEKELEWVQQLHKQGYSNKDIAESVDRTLTSVAIKIKRLGKKQNTYNEKHVVEKYALNHEFVRLIKPTSVLDLYCGEKDFYSSYNIRAITNDKSEEIQANYNMDALACACYLYSQGETYDVVDLDPFGSAYDCFDLAVKMAKKGLVITLGELGHKRWKRLDYVSRYYGIESLEDFTIERLVEHIQMIGRRNKKLLTPVFMREWRNIGRVWFAIEPLKITEQWDVKIEREGN